MEPVDGYSVEFFKGSVILTLSNRYGEGEIYEFPPEDALTLAVALMEIVEASRYQ